MNNNTHLFLFTIGPVQSFIAQARKTQDLYAGSQILSALIKIGVEAFEHEFPGGKGKIIFPDFERKEKNGSLPSRFIGKIEGISEEFEEKAKAIQIAVEAEWKRIAAEVSKKTNMKAPIGFDDQIKAHLDIHWVFQSISAVYSAEAYKEAYRQLERLGGAVKNVRQFLQYQHYEEIGEKGRKCSIDGINNALFYRKNGKVIPAYLENATNLERFTLNPGEGLSAVSLVKRFYLEEQEKNNKKSFPSTAEVALMYDKKQLPKKEKNILDCYEMLFSKKEKLPEVFAKMVANECIKEGRITRLEENKEWNDQFDYQMLFEENLNEKNIPDPNQLELARQLQARLASYFKTKYYALVLFDGDNMGKWLSGEYVKPEKDLEVFHNILSGALSKFSAEARAYLNQDNLNGQTVYTGGDDFLGFVNIHHLFPVMKELRQKFDKTVNATIQDFKLTDKPLTFSAGIVIAHYKTPFSEVLKIARDIEKKAKREVFAGEKPTEKIRRNAFGITVIKHSGEVQEAVFKWDTYKQSPSGCDNWDALAHVVKELGKDEGHFSNKFIQNLTTEFFQLTGADLYDIDFTKRDTKYLEKALTFEIKRLVGKALYKRGTAEEDTKHKADLYEAVKRLWENTPEKNKVRHFIHALHIADFLTRKTTQDK